MSFQEVVRLTLNRPLCLAEDHLGDGSGNISSGNVRNLRCN